MLVFVFHINLQTLSNTYGFTLSGWSHPFGAYGAYGEETNGPQSPRNRYNGPSMMPGVNPSAVSAAAALTSQYTRAHQVCISSLNFSMSGVLVALRFNSLKL